MSKSADIEKAYALIIGISKYKDQGIRRLNYTHADAEELFELLKDPNWLGLKEDNIKVLLDEAATRFNIRNVFTNWLYNKADEDSNVFIFFAGHGHAEQDRTGIEKDNIVKYLLPYDTVVEDIYNSAISNREFHELLQTIRSRKLVIFMDSCYSGGVSGGSDRDIAPMITDDPYKKLGEGEGRIVIAASQANQRSYEHTKIKHGVFTYNLLKALKGEADRDGDGYVKVLDAFKYLEERVPETAMELLGFAQKPIMRGMVTNDIVISINKKHFDRIERDKVIQGNISKLLELRNQKTISGKQYERLRNIVKADFEKLSDKDRKIANLVDDFLSEYISITTFIEDMEIIDPGLFETSEKEKQEQERLRREGEEKERIQKEREKALKEEEERKDREKQLEKGHIAKEEGIRNVWDSSKQLVNIRTIQYVKIGQKEIEKSGFLGFGRKKELIDVFTEKKVENEVEIRQNSVGMKFVLIPAGEFMMGSREFDSSKPVHKVKINMPFYLGIYPVTQKEWKAVMEIDSSHFKGDDLPVEMVSWNDVQEFIRILNERESINKYRLPSEAEWEYAARSGTTTMYSFGDDESKLGDYAWYSSNSGSKTHGVGQKKPNLWGLYDMHGNVWEWVQDKWHSDYADAPTDGSSWESGDGSTRVYRGGSWNYSARYCRSAYRSCFDPALRDGDLGFRLLRVL